MKINDEGRSNAAYWHKRATEAEARLQKIMARCADLLDEDQFNELDAMVTSQPSRAIIQQAKECGCGICDACVAAPAQKTLTDLAREMNYQPSRYEAHLEARLAEAEAMLRDARSSIPGNAKFTLRRIDAFLRADVTTVTVPVAPEAK